MGRNDTAHHHATRPRTADGILPAKHSMELTRGSVSSQAAVGFMTLSAKEYASRAERRNVQSLHDKTKGMVIRMKFSAKKCKATVGALLLAVLTLMSVSCTRNGMNAEDGTVQEDTSPSTTAPDGMNK